MTSSDPQIENLANILRYLLRGAVNDAVTKARTPTILPGTVEDLSPQLDVAHIRNDLVALGEDPTESDNFEAPGTFDASRLGETYTGDQVRVVFDGSAGGSAQRTSAENVIVLPYGAESGQRIVFDGNTGTITFYDENDDQVILFTPDALSIGDLMTPGNRVTIDPLGGIRFRNGTDALVSILDQNGLTLRDAVSGLVVASLQNDGSLKLVDPNGTDDIELLTSGTGTLATPGYTSATEASPGSSLVVPATTVHNTTDHTDLSVGYVAAWLASVSQAATMTQPGGWAERLDAVVSQPHGTLQPSVATLVPSTGLAGTFTSSQSNWQHAVGTHVIVHGDEGITPAFRSVSTSQDITTAGSITGTVAKPAGVVQGDVLLAFVALGTRGGLVPTGWTTPPGFVFLGANWLTIGSGASQSTLAVGVWAKLAGPSEPATYSTTINLPTGTKTVHTTMVALSTPGTVPGGVQIRIAGRPIRRLLAFNELAAGSSTLCDFQNIPQSYDNLELVLDATANANGGAGNHRVRLRCNGDAGNNYHYRFVSVGSGGLTNGGAVSQPEVQIHGIASLTGNPSAGHYHILGYARSGSRRVGMGQAYWTSVTLADIRSENNVFEYVGTGGVNRIQVFLLGTVTQFATGSKAYLYGY